jgi:hypothetical protein
MAQTFLEYLKAEALIAQADAALIPPVDDLEEQCRAIVNAGLMTEDEINEVQFFYKMNVFLDENKIILNQNDINDDFFVEYLSIAIRGFKDYLNLKVTYRDIEITSFLQQELFIYQSLKGSDGNSFIVGIAAPADTLMEMAVELYGQLGKGLDLPEFEQTPEDMHDFYFELLNNINSTCSYKFNLDFDLELPQYRENAALYEPYLYTVGFSVLEYNITIFLVHGDSYNFEVGDNG